MTGYIYTLNDDNNVPIYVGSTTLPLTQRLQGHISSIKNYNYPIYKYIRSNKINISISLLQEVCVVDKKELLKSEKDWIKALSEKGITLLNSTSNSLLIDSGTDLVEVRWETVKIKKRIVEKVRANQTKTGVPVATFFEQAAEEKLKPKK